MIPRPVYIAFRIVIPLLILGAGAAGFVALANLRNAPVRSRPEQPLPLVETVAVEEHHGEMTIQRNGTVVPFREISLSAEVAGRVTYKSPHCRAGKFVEQDEVLFRINEREYELEVDRLTHEQQQARASIKELNVQIESAQSLVKLATAELALRTRELERVRMLAKQNAASDSDIDTAEQNEQLARRTLAQQQNLVRLEQSREERLEIAFALVGTQLEKAELDLARTEVKAPTSGVIVSDPAEEDSFVQPGTALATLEDTSSVEVRCSLQMDELYWIWQHDALPADSFDNNTSVIDTDDQTSRDLFNRLTALAARGMPAVPATVIYELGGQRFVWDGRLSRYEGAGLDARTRTVPCRVLVQKPTEVSIRETSDSATFSLAPQALLRGMYVTLEFHVRPRLQLLRIPEAAVRPGHVIWLVRDGKLERRVAKVARFFNGFALIPATGSGLVAGDRVVTSPLATELSGQPVQTVNDAAELIVPELDDR
ncbi:MAG: HlyD family efflux transporter periplasmic adaptor subunit [Planctomycetota bacterium]|nr:HlyD family efflux transporter periplasmic adaptor subunit [Planctomycetota bacterium]